MDLARRRDAEDERIPDRLVVRHDDHRPVGRDPAPRRRPRSGSTRRRSSRKPIRWRSWYAFTPPIPILHRWTPAEYVVAVTETAARIGTVRPRTSRISQIVTLVAVIVPPLGILSAMGLLWGVAFHPARPRALRRLLRRLRVRDDDRLPPLLHAPRLRDEPAGRGDARDPRLHDDARPDHAVGHRSPQASRLLGPARRPALAARRPPRRGLRRGARLRPRARRLALLEPRHGAGPRVREGSLRRTSWSAGSTGCISSG